MIRYYCDRCGASIPTRRDIMVIGFEIHTPAPRNEYGILDASRSEYFQLCTDCGIRWMDELRSEEKTHERTP